LTDTALKQRLQSCATADFYPTDFTIAHRGAPLGYPEHSREGYIAAAEQGAGVIECDVTFTKDLELVCRHSQCDLATTTNILQTPLAAKCSAPFRPASDSQRADATCCTSDITLTEFKTLCARPDRSNPKAKSLEAFLLPLQSPVVSNPLSCGTLMTHAESIELIDELGKDFTPELKRPEVPMPFAPGFTQAAYADKLIAEYQAAGIDASRVYPQSFRIEDVWHWIESHPDFAEQTVWLDPRGRARKISSSQADFEALRAKGLRIIAPPLPLLLTLDSNGTIVPSAYARQAKAAGLEIITWTFEAGDPTDAANWMYAPIHSAMTSTSETLQVLHVLAEDVGVRGIFSDWPGTITYYANCMMTRDELD
jgi:glycerophosphoryl diester phosphodiesterase